MKSVPHTAGNQRVLVTGARGFTGRHLCKFLRDRGGCEVFEAGREPEPGVEGYDLADSGMAGTLLEKIRPTEIFHCAGSFTNSWETDFQANVAASRGLLEALRALGTVCRVLLIGSAAEYGEASHIPVSETCPLRPVSIYGITKVMQTALMEYYTRHHGMNIVMARTFNLYGDGCSPLLFPGRVLQQAKQVRDGIRPKIEVRSLKSSRDYLHVGAAVLAYLRIMKHGTRGEIYNVGSGQPVRMDRLILELISPFGLSMSDVEILAEDTETKTDVPVIYADIGKLGGINALADVTR